MSVPKLSHVLFFQVMDNVSKLKKLTEIIYKHFVRNENVLVAVSSKEAAIYVDNLLWKLPEESFIPHAIANSSVNEKVAITFSASNVNRATILVNLCHNLPDFGSIDVIYELLDSTSSEKEIASRKKQEEYRNLGHQVEEI